MAFRNDNVNPNLVKDPIGQKKVNEEGTKAARRALEEALVRWKPFMESSTGIACARLADFKLDRLNTLLSMSLQRLCQEYSVSEEMAKEWRAMWRGKKEVWMELKTEGDALERQLRELDGVDEEPKSKKARWQKAPKEEKQA